VHRKWRGYGFDFSSFIIGPTRISAPNFGLFIGYRRITRPEILILPGIPGNNYK
jgi:hypothetical protein